MQTINCLIVGVGGQGTLLAGKILGEYARLQNLDVKVSEVHGMAQRGGCVVTHVRIAQKVASPLVEERSADALLAFEPVEALRWAHMLRPEGVLISATEPMVPLSVTMGRAAYPEDIQQRAKAYCQNCLWVNAGALAKEAGNSRATNVVLLGVFAQAMGLDADSMREAIRRSVKPAFVEVNLKALELGIARVKAL